MRHRPTRGLPIVAGFSQGGMLSYALALRAPDRLRLAIPIAGELPDPLWPAQPASGKRLPIRALHGTADVVIEIDGARKLVERMKSLSYDATLREFPGATHTITPEMQAELNTLLRQQL
jgi:phospholipase/carboxylesterase